jgi:hypothetical protein
MEPKIFRATWSVNWRTVGWPFGLIRVSDSEIKFYSWHLSWWVRDETASRETVGIIERLHPAPGAHKFVIQRDGADSVTFRTTGADGDLFSRDLQLHGHAVDLS